MPGSNLNEKKRSQPNILICGTPGTGKTTTAELISLATGLRHLEIGTIVKDQQLYSGFDEELNSHILDEDRLLDALEDQMAEGGLVVDYHGCDFFPERWFDLVVVLRTDNGILYSRLEQRGYSEKKITENIECEIMMVLLEEAKESYDAEKVVELSSNTVAEMEENVLRIEAWIDQTFGENS